MITQKRIDEIAKDAVFEAVRDLMHDRMGQSELLEDEPGWDDLDEAAQEAECDRLEAAIKLHLPPDQQ